MKTEIMYKVSNEVFNVLNNKNLSSDEKRLHIYTMCGFTEQSTKDPNWRIRREAYRVRGFNEDALTDENCFIKLEAAVLLGKIKFNDNISKILARAV